MKISIRLFALASLFFAGFIEASLTEGKVIQGTVSFIKDSNDNLIIHCSSEETVIAWEDFSIQAGEVVLVTLPSSKATLAIRVSEKAIIDINGKMEAPLGDIALTSPQIQNFGTLSAPMGSVFLDAKKLEILGEILAADKIHLLGDEVNIGEGARIAASTSTSGGEVIIGGDLQGGNPLIKQAKKVYFAPSAHVDASAKKRGNGGRVILWSDDSTEFYGTISTRGGTCFGDGGFVEVSSRGHLDFQGLTDRSAPQGKPGTLLIDPSDITIIDGLVDTNISVGPVISATAASAILTQGTIQSQLFFGNVIVTTSSSFSADGDIVFQLPIFALELGGSTISFVADRDIIMPTLFLLPRGGGDVSFIAGRDFLLHADGVEAGIINETRGTLTITAGRDATFLMENPGSNMRVEFPGIISITAGQDVVFTNNQPFISTERFNVYTDNGTLPVGYMTITAGRNVSASSVSGSSGVHFSARGGQAAVTMTAGVNINFGNGVTTTSSGNPFDPFKPLSFTLVVDAQNSTIPNIGAGSLVLAGDGIDLSTSTGNDLQIFTARREQNSIGGTVLLNGVAYVPGPLFIDSATEQWYTYYPSNFGGTPYTIFYKNGPAPAPPQDLTGKKGKNEFVGQTEYITLLRWLPSATPGVVSYNVYVNGVLYANIPAGTPLKSVIQNRCKKVAYTYEVTAINAFGVESTPAIIVL